MKILTSIFLTLLFVSPSYAVDKCVVMPDALSDQWVSECEPYYTSGHCVVELKEGLVDKKSRAATVACDMGRDRIRRFKAAKQ